MTTAISSEQIKTIVHEERDPGSGSMPIQNPRQVRELASRRAGPPQMKRHRNLYCTAHPTPIGRAARLEHFAHFASPSLEVGVGQDLVVGDDV